MERRLAFHDELASQLSMECTPYFYCGLHGLPGLAAYLYSRGLPCDRVCSTECASSRTATIIASRPSSLDTARMMVVSICTLRDAQSGLCSRCEADDVLLPSRYSVELPNLGAMVQPPCCRHAVRSIPR